jgi:hypothetical protein
MQLKCFHTACLQDFLADEAKLRRRLSADVLDCMLPAWKVHQFEKQ